MDGPVVGLKRGARELAQSNFSIIFGLSVRRKERRYCHCVSVRITWRTTLLHCLKCFGKSWANKIWRLSLVTTTPQYIYLLAKLIFFHPAHVYMYTTSSTYCVGYVPKSERRPAIKLGKGRARESKSDLVKGELITIGPKFTSSVYSSKMIFRFPIIHCWCEKLYDWLIFATTHFIQAGSLQHKLKLVYRKNNACDKQTNEHV